MAYVFRRPWLRHWRRRGLFRPTAQAYVGVSGVGAVGGTGVLSTKVFLTIGGVSASAATHAATILTAKSTNISGVGAIGAAHAISQIKLQSTLQGKAGVAVTHGPQAGSIGIISGLAASGATHALSVSISESGHAVGVKAVAVANPITGNQTFPSGVSAKGAVRAPYFTGEPWNVNINGVGAIGRMNTVIALVGPKPAGVSAAATTVAIIGGYTLRSLASSAATHLPIHLLGPNAIGVVATGVAGALKAAVGNTPAMLPVTCSARVGSLSKLIKRSVFGISGVARSNFSWRSGFFGVHGLSAHAFTNPTAEYFYGNDPMLTRNALELLVTDIPVGSTVAPIGDALIVYSTSASAPIWWNGTQWDLLFGGVTAVLPGFMYHLHPNSITGSSTTATLSVTPGAATDSTGASLIQSVTTIAWSVANGNAINGFDGGTTLPPNSTINFFICSGTLGIGVFASTLLAPTFPTGYAAAHRRIFSLTTAGNGALRGGQWVQNFGGSMIFWYTTSIEDLLNVAPGTSSRTSYVVSVPKGNSMQWLARVIDSSNAGLFIVTGPAEPDVAPSPTSGSLYDVSNASDIFSSHPVFTDVNGNICIRASATLNVDAVTIGFIDGRSN